MNIELHELFVPVRSTEAPLAGNWTVEEVMGHQFPAASIAFNAVAIGK
jgi:hypothetical protein